MSYGTIKVDTITFTDGGVDKSVSVSGLTQNPTFSGNLTVTGTISGVLVQGQTVSGATVTGNAGVFTTVTGGSAGFTTVTGTTVTGTTANFTTLSGTTITGSVGNFGSGSAAAPSVSVGTTDNGIYSPGADQVAVATNGTGRLFVNSSGQVGINGAPPAWASSSSISVNEAAFSPALSYVGGEGELTHNAYFDGAWKYSGTGYQASRIQLGIQGAISFFNTPTLGTAGGAITWQERLRITSTGLVGVGTSSPVSGAQLTVAGSALAVTGQNLDHSANSIRIGEEGSGAAQIRCYGPNTSTNGSLTFKMSRSDGTNSQDVVIDGSGRLGIGTSSPGAPLNVRYDNAGTTTVALFENQRSVGGSADAAQIAVGARGYNHTVIRQNSDLGTNAIGSTLDTVIANTYGSPGAKLILATQSTARLTVDASGNVGIGNTAPGNQNGSASQLVVGNTSSNNGITILTGTSNDGVLNFNDGDNNSLRGYVIYEHSSDSLRFASNGSERFRCDSSGRLLVGTSTARSNFFNNTAYTPRLQLEGTGTAGQAMFSITSGDTIFGPYLNFARQKSGTIGGNTVVSSQDILGNLSFQGSDGTEFVEAATISAAVDGTPGANDMPGRLVFSTTADGASSPRERFIIPQAAASSLWAPQSAFSVSSGSGAGTLDSVFTGFYGGTGPATASLGTISIRIWNNGNIVNQNNSYGSLSDLKLKENIVDASSQWNDIKALQVRKYNFKEGQTHTQIGLVAQEVELVSPGLVSESPDRDDEGNDLGTVTKSVNYSVLYMKAVKALQEAMERIEQLETEMAAVKAQLS